MAFSSNRWSSRLMMPTVAGSGLRDHSPISWAGRVLIAAASDPPEFLHRSESFLSGR
jgi:hypothetical protein